MFGILRKISNFIKLQYQIRFLYQNGKQYKSDEYWMEDTGDFFPKLHKKIKNDVTFNWTGHHPMEIIIDGNKIHPNQIGDITDDDLRNHIERKLQVAYRFNDEIDNLTCQKKN